MTEKRCPMCDGECILKAMATESGDISEVDVCSLCGMTYPRGKGEDRDEGRE